MIGGSDDLTSRALAIANELKIEPIARLAGPRGGGGSDHASFAAINVPVVFLNRPDDPRYHTARDQAEYVSREALTAAGRLSLRLIDDLAGRR
jgi:hypothetical protein